MHPPSKGYLICSEPRSGTTLLKAVLASTGSLGHPGEHLRLPHHSRAAERSPAGVRSLLERAATPNGIYGMKLFSYQLDLVRKGRFIEQLPQPHFVYVERCDVLGQAISYVRALQSGKYVASVHSDRAPRYDRRAIDRELRRILLARSRWQEYFATNGIAPLAMTYEDFAEDPALAVEAIARLLDLPVPDIGDASLFPARQSDARSDEWRARYLEEARDINRLPNPYLPGRLALRRLIRNLQAART